MKRLSILSTKHFEILLEIIPAACVVRFQKPYKWKLFTNSNIVFAVTGFVKWSVSSFIMGLLANTFNMTWNQYFLHLISNTMHIKALPFAMNAAFFLYLPPFCLLNTPENLMFYRFDTFRYNIKILLYNIVTYCFLSANISKLWTISFR